MPAHALLRDRELHVPGYIGNSDPGAVGAGQFWTDTTLGAGRWVIKVRNESDSGWEIVSTSSILPLDGHFRVSSPDGRLFLQWLTADGGDGKFYELKFYTDPGSGEKVFGYSAEGVSTVVPASSLPVDGALRIKDTGEWFLRWHLADGGDDLYYELKFYTDPGSGEKMFGHGETGEA